MASHLSTRPSDLRLYYIGVDTLISPQWLATGRFETVLYWRWYTDTTTVAGYRSIWDWCVLYWRWYTDTTTVAGYRSIWDWCVLYWRWYTDTTTVAGYRSIWDCIILALIHWHHHSGWLHVDLRLYYIGVDTLTPPQWLATGRFETVLYWRWYTDTITVAGYRSIWDCIILALIHWHHHSGWLHVDLRLYYIGVDTLTPPVVGYRSIWDCIILALIHWHHHSGWLQVDLRLYYIGVDTLTPPQWLATCRFETVLYWRWYTDTTTVAGYRSIWDWCVLYWRWCTDTTTVAGYRSIWDCIILALIHRHHHSGWLQVDLRLVCIILALIHWHHHSGWLQVDLRLVCIILALIHWHHHSGWLQVDLRLYYIGVDTLTPPQWLVTCRFETVLYWRWYTDTTTVAGYMSIWDCIILALIHWHHQWLATGRFETVLYWRWYTDTITVAGYMSIWDCIILALIHWHHHSGWLHVDLRLVCIILALMYWHHHSGWLQVDLRLYYIGVDTQTPPQWLATGRFETGVYYIGVDTLTPPQWLATGRFETVLYWRWYTDTTTVAGYRSIWDWYVLYWRWYTDTTTVAGYRSIWDCIILALIHWHHHSGWLHVDLRLYYIGVDTLTPPQWLATCRFETVLYWRWYTDTTTVVGYRSIWDWCVLYWRWYTDTTTVAGYRSIWDCIILALIHWHHHSGWLHVDLRLVCIILALIHWHHHSGWLQVDLRLYYIGVDTLTPPVAGYRSIWDCIILALIHWHHHSGWLQVDLRLVCIILALIHWHHHSGWLQVDLRLYYIGVDTLTPPQWLATGRFETVLYWRWYTDTTTVAGYRSIWDCIILALIHWHHHSGWLQVDLRLYYIGVDTLTPPQWLATGRFETVLYWRWYTDTTTVAGYRSIWDCIILALIHWHHHSGWLQVDLRLYYIGVDTLTPPQWLATGRFETVLYWRWYTDTTTVAGYRSIWDCIILALIHWYHHSGWLQVDLRLYYIGVDTLTPPQWLATGRFETVLYWRWYTDTTTVAGYRSIWDCIILALIHWYHHSGWLQVDLRLYYIGVDTLISPQWLATGRFETVLYWRWYTDTTTVAGYRSIWDCIILALIHWHHHSGWLQVDLRLVCIILALMHWHHHSGWLQVDLRLYYIGVDTLTPPQWLATCRFETVLYWRWYTDTTSGWLQVDLRLYYIGVDTLTPPVVGYMSIWDCIILALIHWHHQWLATCRFETVLYWRWYTDTTSGWLQVDLRLYYIGVDTLTPSQWLATGRLETVLYWRWYTDTTTVAGYMSIWDWCVLYWRWCTDTTTVAGYRSIWDCIILALIHWHHHSGWLHVDLRLYYIGVDTLTPPQWLATCRFETVLYWRWYTDTTTVAGYRSIWDCIILALIHWHHQWLATGRFETVLYWRWYTDTTSGWLQVDLRLVCIILALIHWHHHSGWLQVDLRLYYIGVDTLTPPQWLATCRFETVLYWRWYTDTTSGWLQVDLRLVCIILALIHWHHHSGWLQVDLRLYYIGVDTLTPPQWLATGRFETVLYWRWYTDTTTVAGYRSIWDCIILALIHWHHQWLATGRFETGVYYIGVDTLTPPVAGYRTIWDWCVQAGH